jgi:hypothetical protein
LIKQPRSRHGSDTGAASGNATRTGFVQVVALQAKGFRRLASTGAILR